MKRNESSFLEGQQQTIARNGQAGAPVGQPKKRIEGKPNSNITNTPDQILMRKMFWKIPILECKDPVPLNAGKKRPL